MRIRDYVKQKGLLSIEVLFRGKVYTINLYEELQINTQKINDELKEQPTSYAFLSTLNQHFIKRAENAERVMEKYKSMSIKKLYEKNGNVSLAKELYAAEPLYDKAMKDFNAAKDQRNILSMAVKSFEQRAFILQTLSANTRQRN